MGKIKKIIDSHFPKCNKGRYRGQFSPPRGFVRTEDGRTPLCAEMQEAGCIQAVSEPFFAQIMKATANSPCVGCPVWLEHGPDCKCFKKYHIAWPRYVKALNAQQDANLAAITPHNAEEGPLKTLSIERIAAKYGLSKSVVRDIKRKHGISVATMEAAAEKAGAAQ
jgi:hypothetical protein